MISTTVIYWATGLNPIPSHFLIFVAIVLLHAVAMLSFGLLAAAVSPTTKIANAIGPPVILILIIFGGRVIFFNLSGYFLLLVYLLLGST